MHIADISFLEVPPLDDDAPTLRMSRDPVSDAIVLVGADDVDGAPLDDPSARSADR